MASARHDRERLVRMTRQPSSARRMRSRAPRRGATLVELLVSLPLAMLAAVAAAVLLARQANTSRIQSSALATTRELRHAAQALAADIEPLSGRHLTVVSDTLLQFREQLGVLALCDVPDAYAVIVATPYGSGDSWVGALRPGDVLRVWVPAPPTRPPVERVRTLSSAPRTSGTGVCATNASPTRRWRLTFADSVPRVAAGTPISAHRDARYRLYRSGTAWWLGRQSREASGWETIQPVAGPLRTPSNGGMSIEARDARGVVVPVETGTPDSTRAYIAQIRVALSMPRRTAAGQGPRVDSAVTVIPLRADAFRHH